MFIPGGGPFIVTMVNVGIIFRLVGAGGRQGNKSQ
jgi:hypothetical protein